MHRKLQNLLFLAACSIALCAPLDRASASVKTVVLVHGAFADGSGWRSVADILKRDGYKVLIVQEPETGYAQDLAATMRVLDAAGPNVLVGHSYGGMIITDAGAHDAVRALVYVAAFIPEVGETAGGLGSKMPALTKAIVPVGDGFLQVEPATFPADFAADVPRRMAEFMAISQVPIASDVFGAAPKVAPWKTKPTFAVVAKNDRMLNPDLERFMAKRAKAITTELPSSHAVFISHAKEVAAVIEKAANAAQ